MNQVEQSWLSPSEKERDKQIKILKELFPSYPYGYEKWQYMNSLLSMAIGNKRYLKIMEIK